MLADILLKWGGFEVSPMAVYTDIFNLGDNVIQRKNEESGFFKANPIAYWKNDADSKGHYRIMFEDTFEETLQELQAADFAILNGITYFGRKNVQDHASKMYALIFDLDGVTDSSLNNFFNGAFKVDAYPIPNYVVLSGHGVHLYYLFDYPIPLFPNIKLQLKELKYALTEKIWNMYTSTEEIKQFQGINQGFRVIGGKTKGNAKEQQSRAFCVNTHPFTLRQLNAYVPQEHWIDEKKLFKESKMNIGEARKKYPEWYEKVVVNKDKTTKKWDISEKVNGDNPYALYDWWKRKIETGATFHHRYFNIMCLAIYGVKCGVPYEKVKQDSYDLIPFMNEINPDEPFTKADVKSALECYDARYCTFPIDDIMKISGISIEKNKRNGRKQEQHMAIMRAVQNIVRPDWREGNGRKPKRDIVIDYLLEHPDAKKADVVHATGLSKPTVYKYYDEFKGITPAAEKRITKAVKEKNEAISDKYFEQIMQQLKAMKLTEEQKQQLFDATIASHSKPPVYKNPLMDHDESHD